MPTDHLHRRTPVHEGCRRLLGCKNRISVCRRRIHEDVDDGGLPTAASRRCYLCSTHAEMCYNHTCLKY